MVFITCKRIFSVAVAFIIFGIMDNGIMVISGTAIDGWLRSSFGFSTMFAAGLGNTLSDAIGILTGRYVESYVHQKLPTAQYPQPRQWQIMIAEGLGIVIGCLIGLLPLYFI